ncbi:MAG: ABC transporter substrate-binding protein [Actinomycetaceae bacterium]|nr:ABC transporter substrate-binding protein [Actinomycetaceae bacterium]
MSFAQQATSGTFYLMTRRIRFILVLFAVCSLLVLSGCASHQSNESGAITTNGSEPENLLIPANTNEVGGGKILDLIFSGLVAYTPEGRVENEVAESITTDDEKTYTITLKKGWTFSDGSPVKAHNFANAWKLGAKEAMIASSNYSLIEGTSDDGTGQMSGVSTPDDQTLVVKLKQADAEFVSRLGHQSFYPLPDAAFGTDGKLLDGFGEHPIGNGMYKFKDENSWVHNQKVELVKNSTYAGTRKPKNDALTINFYTRIEAAYEDLRSGRLDIIDKIPYSSIANYEQDLDGRSVSQPTAWIQHIVIPGSVEHFGFDEEGSLRRAAMSRAISREEIIDKIFHGTMTPATDFTSPVLPGYTKDLEGAEVLKYDAKEAKKLWDEAEKISHFTGKFTIAYNSDDNHQAWVEAVAHQLKNTLGMEVSAQAYSDFGTLRKMVNAGEVHGALRFGYQAGRPTQVNLLENLFIDGATANDAGYHDPEFDSLLKEAISRRDEAERFQAVREAQSILLKDLPAIPMWNQNVVGGWSERVKNVTFDWHGVPVYWQVEIGS